MTDDATRTAGSAVAEPILSVRDLRVAIRTRRGEVDVVRGVDFDLARGETLGIVGESGSGKTLTALALVGLVPGRNARVSGSVMYGGRNLVGARTSELVALRGRDFGFVFQDPMSALNPVRSIGAQITEAIHIHNRKVTHQAAWERAIELLREVGMPRPELRARQYPHQLSGGMRQRVVIAMAIANGPAVLLADEPTTALDMTIQAQVMEVFRRVRYESGGSAILITHDLALVSEVADRVLVFYGGRVVEQGAVDEVLRRPRHPYTQGLLACMPDPRSHLPLVPLPGEVPEIGHFPQGCAFVTRCALAGERERCHLEEPSLRPTGGLGHASACHYFEELVDIDERALSAR
jgi:oligopeptide/dipeptide ABC transporter ATP-binding protein